MRVTRTLRLVAVVVVAVAATTGPAGAAKPAQRCTRPVSEAQAGTAVARPGANARAATQKLTVAINLLACTPPGATGGAGTLAATFKPSGPQTCALVNARHTLNGTGKITWKNGKTSALSLTLSLSGASRVADAKGRVKTGLFAGHSVSGQFRYVPVASHHGTTVAQACVNKVAPNHADRNSIVKMNLSRTTPFTIS